MRAVKEAKTLSRARQESSWFEEEVLALLPDLLSGVSYMAEGPAEAEDLVAEAVTRAWERREDLRERERFRGWLFRILRNCCLARLRRREARPEQVPLPEVGTDAPSFSLFERLHQPFLLWWGNPEEEFLNGLLEEDLDAAVSGLPEHYRDVVVLADVQNFTYAEIADALNIPVGTVRSRLARARSPRGPRPGPRLPLPHRPRRLRVRGLRPGAPGSPARDRRRLLCRGGVSLQRRGDPGGRHGPGRRIGLRHGRPDRQPPGGAEREGLRAGHDPGHARAAPGERRADGGRKRGGPGRQRRGGSAAGRVRGRGHHERGPEPGAREGAGRDRDTPGASARRLGPGRGHHPG